MRRGWLLLAGAAAAPELCAPADMPRLALAANLSIPAVGLGLYYTPPGAAAYEIVREALRAGYRWRAEGGVQPDAP